MTLQKDARGEALSTERSDVLALYEQALDQLNSLRLDPVATLQPALELDPDFISGHLLMAGLMLSAIDAQVLPQARDSLGAAAAASTRRAPTVREQSLLAALQPWADGDMGRANRLLGRHLVDHPRDLFALQLTHLQDLVLGQSTLLRDRIGRALRSWSPQDAGYGYVLGMQAFGFEECNEYARAEAAGFAALERNPADAWAVHAIAHVYEMQGRAEQGIRWLTEGNTHWQQDNMLAVHNWWHLALQHLRTGDESAALALYDRAIAPNGNSMALDLLDASALLWRLMLRGHADVGDRWQVLAARWREWSAPGWFSFNDTHALLAQIGSGSSEGIAAARAAVDAVPAATAPQQWWHEAPAACAAMQAFGEGRYQDCADGLLPLLHATHGFGGSQAQRSIFQLTATEAARRAGDGALYQALCSEAAARTS
jgi:tetratricopeptide (TPR) repeat protein